MPVASLAGRFASDQGVRDAGVFAAGCSRPFRRLAVARITRWQLSDPAVAGLRAAVALEDHAADRIRRSGSGAARR